MTYVVNFGEFAGFGISLEQKGVDNFAVRYGEQLDAGLSYGDAAAKLGQAFMHAAACEGKIDNRTRAEARRERKPGGSPPGLTRRKKLEAAPKPTQGICISPMCECMGLYGHCVITGRLPT